MTSPNSSLVTGRKTKHGELQDRSPALTRSLLQTQPWKYSHLIHRLFRVPTCRRHEDNPRRGSLFSAWILLTGLITCGPLELQLGSLGYTVEKKTKCFYLRSVDLHSGTIFAHCLPDASQHASAGKKPLSSGVVHFERPRTEFNYTFERNWNEM